MFKYQGVACLALLAGLAAGVSAAEDATTTEVNNLADGVSLNKTIAGGFKGDSVAEGQFKFLVSVKQNGKHVNVGTIISSKYVITEAWHFGNCSSAPCGVAVRSGSVSALQGGTLRQALHVTAHPAYQHPHFDIALIEVTPPFDDREVASLPKPDELWPAGTQVSTLAWGGFSNDVLTVLQRDNLTILANEECSGLEGWFPQEQICARSETPGSGLCDGDYGAPILVNGSTIIGLNIYNSCGGPAAPPDRFFDLVPLLPWIQDHISS